MKIALTGGTGFIGLEIASQLLSAGHDVRLQHRSTSDLTPLESLTESQGQLERCAGELFDGNETSLVTGCDAVIHSAVWRDDRSFQTPPADLIEYAKTNVLGSLALMQASVDSGVGRFIFLSTCAVHDVILDDRPLDEAHPLWPKSHYGAHKAAIEKFVHSFGLGQGYPICALRPTGVYGIKRPIEDSKWYPLVQAVAAGEEVHVSKGGKEVHVADVAAAACHLLHADDQAITGQAFACYDRYISEFDVATLAQELSQSKAKIIGDQKRPANEIQTNKLRELGASFGGETRLRETVTSLLDALK